MNWLAHLLLSEPSAAFRIGNLLPDILPPAAVAELPREFRRGAACHQQIDAFTDAHPIVRRSISRARPPLRRWSPVLCDVFYDHFLARDWHQHSHAPLGNFLAHFYTSLDAHQNDIPPRALHALHAMRAGDWPGSYHTVAGIRVTLTRMSFRPRRPFDVDQAMEHFESSYAELEADFAEFFPLLRAHVAQSYAIEKPAAFEAATARGLG
jgi:acyl carrier protein phosphodiesterase